MVVKNKDIEGNYKGIEKEKAYKALGSESTLMTILGLAFGALQLCMNK
jgi:hypothetical protein